MRFSNIFQVEIDLRNYILALVDEKRDRLKNIKDSDFSIFAMKCADIFSRFLLGSQVDFIADKDTVSQETNSVDVTFCPSQDTEKLVFLAIEIAYHVYCSPEWKNVATPTQFEGQLNDMLKDPDINPYDLDYELREYLLDLKNAWIEKNSIRFDIA